MRFLKQKALARAKKVNYSRLTLIDRPAVFNDRSGLASILDFPPLTPLAVWLKVT